MSIFISKNYRHSHSQGDGHCHGHRHRHCHYQSGYVALFSTIILSAVFVLLFIGMFGLAAGGMSRMMDKEKSIGAIDQANICVEEALNSVRNDPTKSIVVFHGDEEEGCQIRNVEEFGGGTIIFEAVGMFEDYVRVAEVTVTYEETPAQRLVEVVEWKEEL